MKHLPALATTLAVILFAGTLAQLTAQDMPKEPPAPSDDPVVELQTGNASVQKPAAAEGAEAPAALEVQPGTHGLEFFDKAQMGEGAQAVGRAGGCEVRLGESTTYLVKEVGEETTTISILDVELEMTRGTVMEADFGSLRLNVISGSVQASAEPGTSPTLVITLPDGSVIRATLASGMALSATINSSGNLVLTSVGSVAVQYTKTTFNDDGTIATSESGTLAAANADGEGGGTESIGGAAGGAAVSGSELVGFQQAPPPPGLPPQGTLPGLLPDGTLPPPVSLGLP